MKTIKYICLLILILSLIFTIVKSSDYEDGEDGDYSEDVETTVMPKDVVKRNLVRENITPTQILNNHDKCYKNNKIKKFKGNSLAYVTPWNGKGYDIATKYANKFTHVSPVWFQIKFEKGNYIIEGNHNIDSKWVSTIKTNSNDNTKIIPRFSFEGNQPPGWTKQSFTKVFSDNKFQSELISIITENKFDGLVFEGIVNVPREIRDPFLIKFAEKLHLISKEIFLVVSPIRQKGQDNGFGANDFDKLSKHLDGFSLMTYDYSPSNGMNSPKSWCSDNLNQLLSNTPEHSKKLYMGIPFYGYKTTLDGQTQEAIVGSQFIDILKENKNKKFKWTPQTGEHILIDKNGVSIVYPSLLFLNEHLQLAKQYKASISIWEIGQGLDYFTDLL